MGSYNFKCLHSHAGAYSFRFKIQKGKGTEYLDRVGQSNRNKLSLPRAGSGNPLFDFSGTRQGDNNRGNIKKEKKSVEESQEGVQARREGVEEMGRQGKLRVSGNGNASPAAMEDGEPLRHSKESVESNPAQLTCLCWVPEKST